MSYRSIGNCFRRTFHSSAPSSSHIGSVPIEIPPSVTLSLPLASISPDAAPSSPEARRIIKVTGPLGSQSLYVPAPVIIQPPSPTVPQLQVTVHDPTVKPQRAAWGLARSMIHNAIVGVSTGFTAELRLVGVGYRAAIEPIPQIFLDLQAQMPRQQRQPKLGTPPHVDRPAPTERLNIKLGFSHPVLIDIPHDITVTIPAPTKIVLNGNDKQRVGSFAATIRRWRRPEPYRGKVCT